MTDEMMSDLARRMDATLDSLKKDLGGLRTGRASASLLEPITVDMYGSRMPLSQMATVSVPEPRMLTVQVWDRGAVKAVEKAIVDSDLGLTPQTEGTTLRIRLPELNEERRLELVKVAGKYGEQAKVAVRNIRREGMEALKKQEKDGDISQDEHKVAADKVQKLTDSHVKKVDDLVAAKEKEIKQV